MALLFLENLQPMCPNRRECVLPSLGQPLDFPETVSQAKQYLALHIEISEAKVIEDSLGPSHSAEDGVVHVNVGQRMVDELNRAVEKVLPHATLDRFLVCGWHFVHPTDEVDVLILLHLVEDDWFWHSLAPNNVGKLAT